MGKRQNRRTISYRPEVFEHLAALAKAQGIPLARMLDHIACAELERNGVHVEPYQGRTPPSSMPRLRKPVPRRPEPKIAAEVFPGLDGIRVSRTSGVAAQEQQHGAYVEL